MTPERKQWWGSLPTKQKYLRREISRLKYERSKAKLLASTTWSVVVKITALNRINCYTAHIRALKHELDRTTVVTYTERYEGATGICRCEKCGSTFKDFGQTHCCWCVEADNADAAQAKAEAEAPEDFKDVYYFDYVKEVQKYE